MKARNLSLTVARLALLWCILSTTIAADPADELVQMCHNGTTITVQRRFVARRLALGDTLGPCVLCVIEGFSNA